MKLAVTNGPNWKSLVFVNNIAFSRKKLNEIVRVSYMNRFGNIYIDNIVGTDWFNNEYL